MNEINKIEVGNRIHVIRLRLGLTLEEFGKKVGNASKGNALNWEKGKNLPNKKRLVEIAKLGNISVDYLINGKDESIRNSILYICRELFTNTEIKNSQIANKTIEYANKNNLDLSNISYDDLEQLVVNIHTSLLDIKEQTKKISTGVDKNEQILINSNLIIQQFIADIINKFFNDFTIVDTLKRNDETNEEFEIKLKKHLKKGMSLPVFKKLSYYLWECDGKIMDLQNDYSDFVENVKKRENWNKKHPKDKVKIDRNYIPFSKKENNKLN